MLFELSGNIGITCPYLHGSLLGVNNVKQSIYADFRFRV